MSTPLDADALLIHGPFLRGLATRLVTDGSQADDLVQQAYLTALEKPPREQGSLRAWLASVTRNLALERGRRSSRVRAWERAAARQEATPSTVEIVEREAVRRHVVEAVLDLDEPYRAAILLRYYEDLPPRTIARRLELPVETVRTHIKRGLARLQSALDTRHGGEPGSWLAALAPLAFSGKASAGFSARSLGRLLDSLSIFGSPAQAAAVVVMLLSATAATLWWIDAQRESVQGDRASAALSAPASLLNGVDPAAIAANDDNDRDLRTAAGPAEAMVPDRPPFITGRLTADDGRPWAHTEVAVSGVVLDDWDLLRTGTANALSERWQQRTALSDENGVYQFSGLQRGAWVVTSSAGGARPFHAGGLVLVDAPMTARAMASVAVAMRSRDSGRSAPEVLSLDADGTLELSMTLPALAGTAVRVRGPDGEPVSGVEIVALSEDARQVMDAAPYASWTYDRLLPLLTAETTDADGLATLHCASGDQLIVSGAGFTTLRHELPAEQALPELIDIPLTETFMASVAGQILDDEQRPVAGALVWLSPYQVPVQPLEKARGSIAEQGLTWMLTDAAGRYRFEDIDRLSTDPWDPRCVTANRSNYAVSAMADGYLCAVGAVRARAEQAHHEIDLTLTPGGPFDLEVIDRASLLPAEGDRVSVKLLGPRTVRSWDLRGVLDEYGTWHHDGLSLGDLEITLTRTRCEPLVRTVEDWAGAPVELLVDFVPVGWSLEVDLRDLAGRPVGFSLPAPWSHEDDGVPVSLTAFEQDPTALLASGQTPWAGLAGHRSDFRREDDRFAIDFRSDWGADQAWIAVWVGSQVVAIKKAPRHTRRLDVVVDTEALARNSSSLSIEALRHVDGEPIMGGEALLFKDGSTQVAARLGYFMSFEKGLSGIAGVVPEAGLYDVLVDPWIGAEALIEDVQLNPGVASSLELTIGPQAQLRSRVAGASNKTRYWLHDAAGRLRSEGRFQSDGRLHLAHLGPGRQRMTIADALGSASLWVQLTQGEETVVPLTFQPSAQVSVTLSESPRQELIDGCLTIHDGAGRQLWREVLRGSQIESLVSGSYVMTLPAGTHRLQFNAAGHPTLSGMVSCPSGETATVALR